MGSAVPPLSSDTSSLPSWSQGLSEDKLAAPVSTLKDKWHLVPAFLQVRGLVRQHIDSFNYFLSTDLKNIVRANNRVVSSADPMFYLKYLDVHVGKPGKEAKVSPVRETLVFTQHSFKSQTSRKGWISALPRPRTSVACVT